MKMGYKKWMIRGSIFLLSFCVQSAIFADNATQTLNHLLANVDSIQANFNQRIVDKNANVVQRSEGYLLLQRPGKFRWQVTKPNSQLVVSNSIRLWVYDPDLDQVTVRLLRKEIGDTPALLLSNTHAAIAERFKVEAVSEAKDIIQWFLLTPKNEDNQMLFIKLGFLNNKIRGMVLADHLGHTTIIDFSNVVTNTHFSQARFNFIPPRGVDVIDETRQ